MNDLKPDINNYNLSNNILSRNQKRKRYRMLKKLRVQKAQNNQLMFDQAEILDNAKKEAKEEQVVERKVKSVKIEGKCIKRERSVVKDEMETTRNEPVKKKRKRRKTNKKKVLRDENCKENVKIENKVRPNFTFNNTVNLVSKEPKDISKSVLTFNKQIVKEAPQVITDSSTSKINHKVTLLQNVIIKKDKNIKKKKKPPFFRTRCLYNFNSSNCMCRKHKCKVRKTVLIKDTNVASDCNYENFESVLKDVKRMVVGLINYSDKTKEVGLIRKVADIFGSLKELTEDGDFHKKKFSLRQIDETLRNIFYDKKEVLALKQTISCDEKVINVNGKRRLSEEVNEEETKKMRLVCEETGVLNDVGKGNLENKRAEDKIELEVSTEKFINHLKDDLTAKPLNITEDTIYISSREPSEIDDDSLDDYHKSLDVYYSSEQQNDCSLEQFLKNYKRDRKKNRLKRKSSKSNEKVTSKVIEGDEIEVLENCEKIPEGGTDGEGVLLPCNVNYKESNVEKVVNDHVKGIFDSNSNLEGEVEETLNENSNLIVEENSVSSEFNSSNTNVSGFSALELQINNWKNIIENLISLETTKNSPQTFAKTHDLVHKKLNEILQKENLTEEEEDVIVNDIVNDIFETVAEDMNLKEVLGSVKEKKGTRRKELKIRDDATNVVNFRCSDEEDSSEIFEQIDRGEENCIEDNCNSEGDETKKLRRFKKVVGGENQHCSERAETKKLGKLVVGEESQNSSEMNETKKLRKKYIREESYNSSERDETKKIGKMVVRKECQNSNERNETKKLGKMVVREESQNSNESNETKKLEKKVVREESQNSSERDETKKLRKTVIREESQNSNEKNETKKLGKMVVREESQNSSDKNETKKLGKTVLREETQNSNERNETKKIGKNVVREESKNSSGRDETKKLRKMVVKEVEEEESQNSTERNESKKLEKMVVKEVVGEESKNSGERNETKILRKTVVKKVVGEERQNSGETDETKRLRKTVAEEETWDETKKLKKTAVKKAVRQENLNSSEKDETKKLRKTVVNNVEGEKSRKDNCWKGSEEFDAETSFMNLEPEVQLNIEEETILNQQVCDNLNANEEIKQEEIVVEENNLSNNEIVNPVEEDRDKQVHKEINSENTKFKLEDIDLYKSLNHEIFIKTEMFEDHTDQDLIEVLEGDDVVYIDDCEEEEFTKQMSDESDIFQDETLYDMLLTDENLDLTINTDVEDEELTQEYLEEFSTMEFDLPEEVAIFMHSKYKCLECRCTEFSSQRFDKTEKTEENTKKVKYSRAEDAIIMENFKQFCKFNALPLDYRPFIKTMFTYNGKNKRVLSLQNRHIFSLHLAYGLENRNLDRVFSHFKKIVSSIKERKKFSDEENVYIIQRMEELQGCKNALKSVAVELKRDENRVRRHYAYLKMCKKFNKDSKGRKRFGIAEKIVLIRLLLEENGLESVYDLKDLYIHNIVWKTIGQTMDLPPLYLKAHWLGTLHPQIFVTGTRNIREIIHKFCDLMIEDGIYDYKDVDYSDYVMHFNGMTKIALQIYFKKEITAANLLPKFKLNFIGLLCDLKKFYSETDSPANMIKIFDWKKWCMAV